MIARLPWLLVFVGANIIAAAIIWNTGFLIGDVDGIRLYSEAALFTAVSLVVLSYVIILGPVFSWFSSIKINKSNLFSTENFVANRLGLLLVVLQIFFMSFNLITGVNIAGDNNTRGDGGFSLIWVAVPVDFIFLVYYAAFRETRYAVPNLIIFLISNISRGWVGVFLIIIIFEWCRLHRLGRISIPKASFIVESVMVMYPVLSNIKWIFRASASTSFSFDGLVEGLVTGLTIDDYVVLITKGIEHIIGRVQVTSLVVEVMRFREELQVKFSDGMFAPFWLEGLPGIAYERVFHGVRTMPIGVAFTEIGQFGWEFEVGDWNTNIGYVGWFFISPLLIPLYIFYTAGLCFVSFYLAKKIGLSKSLSDMVWISWLIYLMPPWFGAFINFIYGMLVLFLLNYLISRIPRVTWKNA